MYRLPYKSSNYLKLRILENQEILRKSLKWLDLMELPNRPNKKNISLVSNKYKLKEFKI